MPDRTFSVTDHFGNSNIVEFRFEQNDSGQLHLFGYNHTELGEDGRIEHFSSFEAEKPIAINGVEERAIALVSDFNCSSDLQYHYDDFGREVNVTGTIDGSDYESKTLYLQNGDTVTLTRDESQMAYSIERHDSDGNLIGRLEQTYNPDDVQNAQKLGIEITPATIERTGDTSGWQIEYRPEYTKSDLSYLGDLYTSDDNKYPEFTVTIWNEDHTDVDIKIETSRTSEYGEIDYNVEEIRRFSSVRIDTNVSDKLSVSQTISTDTEKAGNYQPAYPLETKVSTTHKCDTENGKIGLTQTRTFENHAIQNVAFGSVETIGVNDSITGIEKTCHCDAEITINGHGNYITVSEIDINKEVCHFRNGGYESDPVAYVTVHYTDNNGESHSLTVTCIVESGEITLEKGDQDTFDAIVDHAVFENGENFMEIVARESSVKETTMTALSQKAAQSQAPPKQKISGA